MANLYPTITDYPNASGIMPMLFSIRDAVPFAFQALLLTILFILTAAQYFISKNKTGKGKILVAVLTSSLMTTIMASLLALSQLVTFMDVLLHAFICIVFFALTLISDSW